MNIDVNMNRRQFERFCALAYDKAGIKLRKGKEALVTARVAKRLRALNMESVNQYLKLLEQEKTQKELVKFLDVISTNYTYFFRENEHFDLLKTHLDRCINNGQKRIRIWCAAASSGEEPYSLAITMADTVEDRPIDYRLLATDISTGMLEKAREGLYDANRVKPISKLFLTKYFERLGGIGDLEAKFQVKPFLRKRVVFKRLNLTETPFPMKGPLDAIFCRNVMIYFDKPVRQKLIKNMERLVKPGGILVISHTETLTGIDHGLEIVEPSVYRKPHGDQN